MTEKDFAGMDTSRIYDTIREATAEPVEIPDTLPPEEAEKLLPKKKHRRTYSEQETADLMSQFRTSGHKGVKLPRINLAFAPDTYEYIQTMAQVRGQSMTTFVDHIVRKSMEDNKEIYLKALEFRNSL